MFVSFIVSILHENTARVYDDARRAAVSVARMGKMLYTGGMKQKIPIQAVSIVALLAILLFFTGKIFLPYASVLLWSAVFYILLRPLHKKIMRRVDPEKKLYQFKRHFLAGVFSVGTVVAVAFLFSFLIINLAGQISVFVNELISFINSNLTFFSGTESGREISDFVSKFSMGVLDLSSVDIKQQLVSLLRQYADSIISLSRSLALNVSSFVVSLCFMCFSLYFFYVDGPYLANLLISAMPIDNTQMRLLMKKFHDVLGNLVQGLFLVALYQSISAFIIFSIFNVSGSLLLAVMVFFCSFVPMFGCAIVWFPVGLMLVPTRGVLTAVLFMVLCAVFISFLDNFIRPFLLKERIKIHPLLIFFSILGGINFFGFNGVILGPMTVILFFTVVEMVMSESPDGSEDGGMAAAVSGQTDGSVSGCSDGAE